jgi:hypothetical protein
MSKMAAFEITTLQDRVDQSETGGWPIAHGNGHGTVEFDHGRRRNPCKHVVESGNLVPVPGFPKVIYPDQTFSQQATTISAG